ncbi:MAG: hypothetical protein IJS60_05345 [Abditibacteriota bacterium]|nr:hypothetical protein [Abditibacteriota bacterium]
MTETEENINYTKIIDDIAEYVHKKKLETPAIMFLEMNKPLTLFYSSMFLVSTPVLGAFLGPERMKKLYLIMEKRENIEKLIRRIEEVSKEKE